MISKSVWTCVKGPLSLRDYQKLDFFADNEPPEFVVIPGNINITTEAGESFGIASWDIPMVSDNSDNFTLQSTHQPGDMFDIGPTTVIYTLTDPAGNTVTASFTVFVRGMYGF